MGLLVNEMKTMYRIKRIGVRLENDCQGLEHEKPNFEKTNH